MTPTSSDPGSTKPISASSMSARRRHIYIGIAAGILLAFILTFGLGLTRFGRSESDVQPTIVMIYPDFVETSSPDEYEAETAGQREPTVDADAEGGQRQFSTGDWVQVAGTGGDGLNLRNEAGIESAVVLVALENEIFEVRGGPVNLGDVRWWFLVNPYDEAQAGWADDRFLLLADS